MTLSDLDKLTYIKVGDLYCLYCSSAHVKVAAQTFLDYKVRKKYFCKKCEKSWWNIYNLELIDVKEED